MMEDGGKEPYLIKLDGSLQIMSKIISQQVKMKMKTKSKKY